MATPIKHTLKSSGGDYSLMSTWESTAQRNLVALDETETLECYNDWPGGHLSYPQINGWTTGPANRITITVAEGNRGDRKRPETGFYMYSASSFTNCLDIRNSYVTVEWVGFLTENTSSSARILYSSGSDYTLFSKVICVQQAPGTVGYGLNMTGSNSAVENSLFVGLYLSIFASNIRNCTSIDSTYRGIFGSGAVINTVSFGGPNEWDFTDTGGSSNNASSGDGVPGTDGITTIQDSDFVDYAGGDYQPTSTGKLANTAIDLSGNFLDDITGEPR